MKTLLASLASTMQLTDLLAEFPGIAKLAYLMDKKASDLTQADVVAVGTAFGVDLPLTEEVQAAFLAWLQGKNLDSVCDLIQQPESIYQVVEFVRGGLLAVGKPSVNAIQHHNLFLS